MPKRILTVDDSSSVRKLVEFTLKAKGFQVGSASDGLEALEIIAQESFDCIILDINMPKMDGLEFLETIRNDHAFAEIPVIILTTEGQDKDKDRAVALGATAYIVKPFKPTQLLGLVEKILPNS
jgi:two-component system chemotaxis response regulator CheY